MGVFLSGTGNNSIYNNEIKDTQSGIVLYSINNSIYDNQITVSKNGILFEHDMYSNQSSNVSSIKGSIPDEDYERRLQDLVASNKIIEVENPYVHKHEILNATSQTDQTT
jgi:parallel beta-helix repeat protein